MKDIQSWADEMKASIGKALLGKDAVIEKLLTVLLCSGHLLLEDSPGVGKTLLARALAASLGGKFTRIQCTPDLLPSDILGVSVYVPSLKRFRFHPGPIHSHIVLVDEVNRATPRSQSALLEAMESQAVTMEGRTNQLPDPFFLMATENPLEFEGTFPLPEAQKDRFFMTLSMGYPPRQSELDLMDPQGGGMDLLEEINQVSTVEELKQMKEQLANRSLPEEIEQDILELVRLTREEPRLEMGASPRASRALYQGVLALANIRGQRQNYQELLAELALPVLQKRIKIRTDALLNGINEEIIVQSLLEKLDRRESK